MRLSTKTLCGVTALLSQSVVAQMVIDYEGAQTYTGDLVRQQEERLQHLATGKLGDSHMEGKEGEVPETKIVSDGKLCDSGVQQHSGYVQFTNAGGQKKAFFFWFFESKSAPKDDPVVIWLSGGPGCSSQLALFGENGPCKVNKDGSDTVPNPHSWHSNANAMWIDQPAGTGFSYGSWDHNEEGVADDFYAFMQEFYKQLPQYKPNSLVITGESYAGHYIPAIANKIWTENKAATGDKFVIPMKHVAIGNGLTNVEEQYKHYPQMAFDGGKADGGSLEQGVITNPVVQGIMKAGVPMCTAAVHECNNGSAAACVTAFGVCNYAETVPYQLSGYNPYDMRIKCEVPPLCYDFSAVTTYLNKPEVQKALGAQGKWSDCNLLLNKLFTGDFMTNYHQVIPAMLEDGIEFLIYAGDVDYICNWLGNKAWTLALDWKGKEGFNSAPDADYMVNGEKAGRLRKYQNFHFLQIYQAGHMVPMDKPEAALQMLNQFITGKLQEGTKQTEENIFV